MRVLEPAPTTHPSMPRPGATLGGHVAFWAAQACIAAVAVAVGSVTFTGAACGGSPDTDTVLACEDMNPTASPFCAATCAEALAVTNNAAVGLNICLPVAYQVLLGCAASQCAAACPISCQAVPFSGACASCLGKMCSAQLATCKKG